MNYFYFSSTACIQEILKNYAPRFQAEDIFFAKESFEDKDSSDINKTL